MIRKNTKQLALLVRFCFSHQGRKRKFFRVQQGIKKQQTAILPSQYPKNLEDHTPVIHRGRPIRYLTPKHQIPQDKFVQNTELVIAEKYQGKWTSPPNAYSLNIGLIGPVNSGKSQLMGRIIGSKISAVSPKANTTTDTIEGFKSFEIQSEEQGLKNVQLKFYDTAGLMYKKTGFISKGWKVLSEIDFSLLVIDATKRFDQMTRQSIRRLEMHRNYENFMKALVLNKIDLVSNRRKFHTLISEVEKYGKFDKIFYVSALTGYGVEQLQDYLVKMAKKRQWQQPKQAFTNLTEIEIYQEMMKQCLYHRSYKQVPYNITIECTEYAARSNGIDQIRFKFYVESQNQQRMIIGLKGRNLKWIMDRFKVYIAQNLQKQVEVYVEVRIRKKTKAPSYLSEQTFFDEQTQKRFDLQKISVVEDYLIEQHKLDPQNTIQFKYFLEGQKKHQNNDMASLEDHSKIGQLPQKLKTISNKKKILSKRLAHYKKKFPLKRKAS